MTVEEKRGGISRRDRRWRRLTELQIAWDAVLVLLVFVDIVTLPLSVCGFVRPRAADAAAVAAVVGGGGEGGAGGFDVLA